MYFTFAFIYCAVALIAEEVGRDGVGRDFTFAFIYCASFEGVVCDFRDGRRNLYFTQGRAVPGARHWRDFHFYEPRAVLEMAVADSCHRSGQRHAAERLAVSEGRVSDQRHGRRGCSLAQPLNADFLMAVSDPLSAADSRDTQQRVRANLGDKRRDSCLLERAALLDGGAANLCG